MTFNGQRSRWSRAMLGLPRLFQGTRFKTWIQGESLFYPRRENKDIGQRDNFPTPFFLFSHLQKDLYALHGESP